MRLITFVLLVVLLLGAFYFFNLLKQDDKPSEGTRKTTEKHDSSETEITPNTVSEIVSAPISSPPETSTEEGEASEIESTTENPPSSDPPSVPVPPSPLTAPEPPPPTIVSSPPQPPQPTPDESEKVAKRAQQRVFILAEILSTEKTYVAQLQAFHDVFYEPCRSRREQLGLSEMDIKSIFSQLKVILSTNIELLKQLQVSIEENGGEGVGKEIASMSAYLRCYTPYINNYTNSQNTIAELQKNNKAFRKFLKECSQNPASLNFPIESFLILPVQRLPRYKMLIEQLLKYTEENHQEYLQIKSALTTISNLAEQANNRCFENQERMGVIDFLNSINEGLREQKKDVSTIDGSAIVTPLRRLLQKLRVITFTRTRQTDIAIPAGTDEADAPFERIRALLKESSGESMKELKALYIFNDSIAVTSLLDRHSRKSISKISEAFPAVTSQKLIELCPTYFVSSLSISPPYDGQSVDLSLSSRVSKPPPDHVLTQDSPKTIVSYVLFSFTAHIDPLFSTQTPTLSTDPPLKSTGFRQSTTTYSDWTELVPKSYTFLVKATVEEAFELAKVFENAQNSLKELARKSS